jgi:hypothetical protein
MRFLYTLVFVLDAIEPWPVPERRGQPLGVAGGCFRRLSDTRIGLVTERKEMRADYRFEGPPGANGVAPYLSEGRAINAAKIALRNRWRGPGDLVKVFRKTQEGEVFIGYAQYDPRDRVALWYPSGQGGPTATEYRSRRVEPMDAMRLMQRHEADQQLEAFVRESNRIEGIHRNPTPEEIKAHKTLIARKRVKVEHVTALVAVCQPNAILRASSNIPGVRVGNHIAPPSGPQIVNDLEKLLADISANAITPWAAHVRYETLHPYTYWIGFKVILKAMDWSTNLVMRSRKEPPDKGGWNLFHTWAQGWDITNPAANGALSGAGPRTWPGWPNIPQLDNLVTDWVHATNQTQRKQLADEVQKVALSEVPYVVWGEWVQPTACRKNVRDVLKFGAPIFWNVKLT